MESVFDQQSHVQSHHLVMCHHDDGDYLCQIRDSQAGGTVGAGGGTTVAPGIMALAPPGVPSLSPTPFKSASTTALVPDGHTCVVALANVKRWRGEVAVA